MSGMRLWSRLVILALFSTFPVTAQTKPLVFYNVDVFDDYHAETTWDGRGAKPRQIDAKTRQLGVQCRPLGNSKWKSLLNAVEI